MTRRHFHITDNYPSKIFSEENFPKLEHSHYINLY